MFQGFVLFPAVYGFFLGPGSTVCCIYCFCPLVKTLVKNLVKNLVQNLAKNLANNSSDKLTQSCPENRLKTSKKPP